MGRLAKIQKALSEKKISLKEFYHDFIPQIKNRNSKTNAYIEIFEDELDAQKNRSDEYRGNLDGLPIGIKDIISIRNRNLTAASKILAGYRAVRSASVVERLAHAGASFCGRLNCDEFAMGSSNENSAYGPVRNPFHLEHIAGGSSGGSAAAVAAEMCLGSLGTDTGGSIRLPAAFCGITGLKPTYGRVSRSGVIAFASSLDQVGPMADDSLDCAILLQAIAGKDSRDATSLNIPTEDYVAATQKRILKGLKIGLPKEYFNMKGLDPEIEKQTQESIENLKKAGAEVTEISLPHTPYGIAAYYLIATAEASSNLARYDGIRYGKRSEEFDSLRDLMIKTRSEGFGAEVKRRIMLGSFSLSAGYYDAYYAKAQFVRSKIQSEFLEAFKSIDLIFSPASPSLAFKIGERINDPLAMYLMDIFTVSVNLAGLPAIAFPIGLSKGGLPIGAQFIGRPFSESQLLSAVASYEEAFPSKRGALQC